MLRVGIIVGSTRPGRKARVVADWVKEIADKRGDAQYEVIDIADFDLPLLDESVPPSRGQYEHEHTKRWAAAIAPLDAFIFVTPEYNHSTSGAMKNAIDFLYAEWNNKAAGFVGYGSAIGARAVEHLRLICAELQIATVRAQVGLSIFTDWEQFTDFAPAPMHEGYVNTMLDQLLDWGGALKGLRDSKQA